MSMLNPARLFNVISTGRIVDGRDRNELVQKIAELTKQAPETAARLSDGEETIVLDGGDYVRAVKTRDAFQWAGLICRIEPRDEETPSSPNRIVAVI